MENKQITERFNKSKKVKFLYRLMQIFPINKTKIVFTSFEGKGGYCCNPRYIAQKLIDDNSGYKLVWIIDDVTKKFPKEIKVVKNTLLNRAFHLSTAKVWVDNTRKPLGTIKRKGQFYLQTWHAGIATKPIGKFRGKLFPKIAEVISREDSKLIDCVISDSDWCTKLYPDMLLYDGEIIKTGLPRCDVLFNNRERTYMSIRSKYGLKNDSKIVLFAPTFRGGSQQGKRSIYSEIPTLDFAKLQSTLSDKFGGEWHLFLRLHPQLSAAMSEMPLDEKPDNMVDVSTADDMNELIAACDVFITDYSSAAFDALCAKIPTFIYADDYEEYIKERGNLMWDMRALPFAFCENNEELNDSVLRFDEPAYSKKADEFLKEHGVLADGMASERVAKTIIAKLR